MPWPKGKNHFRWKGEDVKHSALHNWIRKEKGKPLKCSKCGITGVRIEWANISHEYKRELSDYMELCRPCHIAYDEMKLGPKPGSKRSLLKELKIKTLYESLYPVHN